ncbi:MAG: hypothetical protein A2W28_12660 [Gammaproteobacteria bacterium RBG_16_51_14]|nr:MAG: hypothetical protein A2W28_12660 [Gammaproteobacteria bacterium RBG_16_51_14]
MTTSPTSPYPINQGSGYTEKQLAIIDAATRIFLEQGYRNASMDAIAREANVSKQTIYNQYGNKEALFSAVITRNCQELLETLQETGQARLDVQTTLSNFATTLLDILLRPSSLALHRLIVAESARFPEVGAIYYREGPERGNRRLAEYLHQQCELGHLCIQDTLLAARQFTGGLISFLRTRALALNCPVTAAEIREVVDYTIACFMAMHGGSGKG